MSRALGVGITSDIAAASGERCQLIQLDFADNSNTPTPVYLTTAARDISWNGFTFMGTGHVLGMDALGESADDPGNGIKVKLSGVEQSILALIMGSRWRGRLATIWYAALDQVTGTVKTDPVVMFQGPMNGGFQIGESRGDFGGGTVDVTGSFTSRLDELVKVRGIRCNVASHQISGYTNATTDTFFMNVDGLAQRKVFWGVKTPRPTYADHPNPNYHGYVPGSATTNPPGRPGVMGGGTFGGVTPGATQSPNFGQPHVGPGIGGVTPGATQSPNFGPTPATPAPNIDSGSHGGGLTSGGSHGGIGGVTPGSR